jgi:hypothetical protein
MSEDQLKKLAETLKNNGLAVSMYEALEKAKSILNVKSQNENSGSGYVASESMGSIPQGKESLNELMEEAGVNSQQVDFQEKKKAEYIKKEVVNIKEELKEASGNDEKIHHIKDEIKEVKEQMAMIPDLDQGLPTGMAFQDNEVEEKDLSENSVANQSLQSDQVPDNQNEFAELDELEENERKNNAEDIQIRNDSTNDKEIESQKDDNLKEDEKIDLTKIFGNNQ